MFTLVTLPSASVEEADRQATDYILYIYLFRDRYPQNSTLIQLQRMTAFS